MTKLLKVSSPHRAAPSGGVAPAFPIGSGFPLSRLCRSCADTKGRVRRSDWTDCGLPGRFGSRISHAHRIGKACVTKLYRYP